MEADFGCSFCAQAVLDALNAAGLGWRWEVVDDEEEGWKVVARDVPLGGGRLR